MRKEGGREGGRGGREGGEGGREEGGREEGGRREGGIEGWREGREGGMEGGRENNINNVLRFLLISSSSERSSVMYVQDTQEGVLADIMSHQSNKSITKILQHI